MTHISDITQLAPAWAHSAVDQLVGFTGLLFFSFFGLLGALGKFRVRLLPYLLVGTILWLVLGLIAIGAVPHDVGGLITPQVRKAWLSPAFVHRATVAWLAGAGIGTGLIAITLIYERCRQSRLLRIGSLVVRTSVFLAAFWLYLRTYVIRS
jgi:hypothetical protein